MRRGHCPSCLSDGPCGVVHSCEVVEGTTRASPLTRTRDGLIGAEEVTVSVVRVQPLGRVAFLLGRQRAALPIAVRCCELLSLD